MIRPFFFCDLFLQTYVCIHICEGVSAGLSGKHWTTKTPEWLTKCQHSSQRPTPNLRWRQGWEVSNFHWSDRTKFWFTSLRFTQICHLYSLKNMSSWWSVDNDNPYFQSIFLWISYGFMFLDFLGFISNLGLMISTVCKSEGVFQGLGDEHRKNASGPRSVWGSVISWHQKGLNNTKQYYFILILSMESPLSPLVSVECSGLLNSYYSINIQSNSKCEIINSIIFLPKMASHDIPTSTQGLVYRCSQRSKATTFDVTFANLRSSMLAQRQVQSHVDQWLGRHAEHWSNIFLVAKAQHQTYGVSCVWNQSPESWRFSLQGKSRKASTSTNHIQATLQVKIQKKQSKSPPPPPQPPPPPPQQQQQQRHAVAYNYYCRAVWLATVCIHSW